MARLIVWDEDSGDGTYDIYGYDLDDSATGVFPICTAAGSQKHPAVSGNIVVWHDVPDEDLEITGTIWAIDLADAAPARFKVSNPADTNANQFPAISGKTIVWQRAGSTDDILGAKLLDPSEVDVTYPNGGESVEAGTSMTITWTSTGPVDNVLIEFSSDGGASWTDVNTIPNTGSYLWDPVADVESTNCLVAVTN
ncbi:MAG: Ser-Thr-rich GPI-anchored membrane family protein, partial [Planctomycetota bacterium]